MSKAVDIAQLYSGNAETGSFILPSGTTAERPSLGANERAQRWNTDLSEWEGWNGTAWEPLASGGGLFKGENGTAGSSAGDIFRINEQTLNTDVTIGSNENASAAGPITIANGVTLTIEPGGNLVIK